MTPEPPSPCPPDSVWDELAAGLIRGSEADRLLEHASWCGDCPAKLRESIEIFAGGEPVPIRPPKPPWRRLAAIPVAAAMVLAAVGGAWWWNRRHDPLVELARAYTVRRTLELRIPGAEHADLKVERGTGGGRIAESPELLDAAARIGRGLAQSARDPHWLRAKGRLALLEWRPDEAIQALEAARDEGGESADLLIDLASAYYQQAGAAGPAGLHKAVEVLGQALRLEPRNPAALFNRALIEEQLQETAAAVADLEQLLAVEPAGAWSQETRQVLARVRSRRGAFFDRGPREDRDRFDEVRLEAMLAGPILAERTGAEFGALARRFRTVHHDPWLAELAALPAAAIDAGEWNSLSRMSGIRLTLEKGRYQHERAAFDAPRRPQPPAVAAWHGFEALYRATHARGEFRCPDSSAALLRLMEARGYRWLAAQTWREQGICRFQSGELEAAGRDAGRAIEVALEGGFPVSAMRARSWPAHIALRRGQFREALAMAHRALGEIDARRLPVARSQEFHNIAMGATSEGLHWWHAARAAAASVVETARAAGMRELEFTGTVRRAQFAQRCGDREAAGRLFQRALDDYRLLAPSSDRAWAEIGFADATGDERRFDEYARTLESAPDPLLWIPYERVKARLALAAGRLPEAQQRLQRIADWMAAPGARRPPGYQWEAEFRAAGQLNIEVLEREGRLEDSYAFLQRWLTLDERARDPVSGAGRVSTGDPVWFAFLPVGERIAAWRREGSDVRFRWATIDRREAERLVRRFERLLESPDSPVPEIHREAAAIRRDLFGTWLDAVAPGRALLIQVNGGPLANLPFAVLPGAHAELGAEHPLAVTPFAAGDARQPERPSLQQLLLVDASDAHAAWAAGLPSLPGARREVDAIRELWPSAEVLRGAAAQPERLAPRLAAAGLLHFAGHALLAGQEVGLVLPGSASPGDWMEWGGRPIRAPHSVVLSACSTGRSTAAVSDTGTPESLAAAFLLKGSGEVIASLWDVDSTATEALMRSFYGQLRIGMDTGRALEAAMAAVRAEARFSHPHYWAAFGRFVRT